MLDEVDERVQLIVLGEHGLPRPEWLARLDPPVRAAVDQGIARVIDETELWRDLGLVDSGAQVSRLYTPRMLAELVAVAPGRLRSWQKQGLLSAAREVHRLAYFDFAAVIAARCLKELSDAGLTTKAIKASLVRLGRWLPQIERPLAELPLVVADGQLLLRRGDVLVDVDGQGRIDFEPASEPLTENTVQETPATADEWLDLATDLDETGDIAAQSRPAALRRLRPVRTPKSRFNWPNSSIAREIFRPRESGISWRSSSTKILSRPVRT